VLNHLPIIHEAVLDRFSSEELNVGFLEEVVKNENIMKSERARIVVSEALRRFWSVETNARRKVGFFDEWNYLYSHFLRPLGQYPEMGRLVQFQEAVSSLLRNAEYPEYVMGYLRRFDGLLQSELVKKETDRLAAEKAAKKAAEQRRRRRLSYHDVEDEIRKAREDAYWDYYDEGRW
jgi:hypothetical protein